MVIIYSIHVPADKYLRDTSARDGRPGTYAVYIQKVGHEPCLVRMSAAEITVALRVPRRRWIWDVVS